MSVRKTCHMRGGEGKECPARTVPAFLVRFREFPTHLPAVCGRNAYLCSTRMNPAVESGTRKNAFLSPLGGVVRCKVASGSKDEKYALFSGGDAESGPFNWLPRAVGG